MKKSAYKGNNQYSGLSQEERFWQKVDKRSENECWEWKGALHYKWRYGHLKFNGKVVAAHRISWLIHFGEMPNDMLICHKCDNPPCVNPKHLFLGTVADNNLDKKLKGRELDAKGENNNRSRLTESDVLTIRELHRHEIYSGAELGRRFGVNKNTIYAILHRRLWSHI